MNGYRIDPWRTWMGWPVVRVRSRVLGSSRHCRRSSRHTLSWPSSESCGRRPLLRTIDGVTRKGQLPNKPWCMTSFADHPLLCDWGLSVNGKYVNPWCGGGGDAGRRNLQSYWIWAISSMYVIGSTWQIPVSRGETTGIQPASLRHSNHTLKSIASYGYTTAWIFSNRN